MEPEDFKPVPTCEIPAPVVEPARFPESGIDRLPRALIQSAGVKTHSRRLLILTAAFFALSVFEGMLLLRLRPRTLVVYQEPTVRTLIEEKP